MILSLSAENFLTWQCFSNSKSETVFNLNQSQIQVKSKSVQRKKTKSAAGAQSMTPRAPEAHDPSRQLAWRCTQQPNSNWLNIMSTIFFQRKSMTKVTLTLQLLAYMTANKFDDATCTLPFATISSRVIQNRQKLQNN